jgi:hypothetical protein
MSDDFLLRILILTHCVFLSISVVDVSHVNVGCVV